VSQLGQLRDLVATFSNGEPGAATADADADDSAEVAEEPAAPEVVEVEVAATEPAPEVPKPEDSAAADAAAEEAVTVERKDKRGPKDVPTSGALPGGAPTASDYLDDDDDQSPPQV
jgi:hypothetical protein